MFCEAVEEIDLKKVCEGISQRGGGGSKSVA